MRRHRSASPHPGALREQNAYLRARLEADEARRLADAASVLDVERTLLSTQQQRANMAADVAHLRQARRRQQQQADLLALEQTRLRQQETDLLRHRRQTQTLQVLQQERARLDRQQQLNDLANDRDRHNATVHQTIVQMAKEKEQQRQQQNLLDQQRSERLLLSQFELEEGLAREENRRQRALRLQNQKTRDLSLEETAREIQMSDEQRNKELQEDAILARRNAELAADETRKAQDSFARWERAQMAEEADAVRRKSALAKLEGEKARLMERRAVEESVRLSTPVTASPYISQAMYPLALTTPSSANARFLSPTLTSSSLDRLEYSGAGYDMGYDMGDPVTRRYGLGLTQVGLSGQGSSVTRLKNEIMRSLPR